MTPGPPAERDLLVRALWVLEALAGMEQPASLPAVVERARLPRSQAYRALRALQHHGYVDHQGRGGYRVAARGLTLGALLGARPELRELARPVLARLSATTSAVAAFHLRSGLDRVLVLAATPPHRAPVTSAPGTPLGERAPLTRGCAGRAILAHLPAPDVAAALAAHPGPVDALRAELARIAATGVAVSYGDNHDGHHGISVALVDPEERAPLGSITLSGDADRFDRDALLACAVPLRAAAEAIAPALAAVLGPRASSRRPSLDV